MQPEVTLEAILKYRNLYNAYKSVTANGGAPGVNGTTTTELYHWFYLHPHQISTSVRQGTYQCSPIRRVYTLTFQI